MWYTFYQGMHFWVSHNRIKHGIKKKFNFVTSSNFRIDSRTEPLCHPNSKYYISKLVGSPMCMISSHKYTWQNISLWTARGALALNKLIWVQYPAGNFFHTYIQTKGLLVFRPHILVVHTIRCDINKGNLFQSGSLHGGVALPLVTHIPCVRPAWCGTLLPERKTIHTIETR